MDLMIVNNMWEFIDIGNAASVVITQIELTKYAPEIADAVSWAVNFVIENCKRLGLPLPFMCYNKTFNDIDFLMCQWDSKEHYTIEFWVYLDKSRVEVSFIDRSGEENNEYYDAVIRP